MDPQRRQRRRLDDPIHHAYIVAAVDLVPAGKTGQVVQRTGQAAVIRVPVQVPVRVPLSGRRLPQRGLQNRFPPFFRRPLRRPNRAEAVQVAAVQGNPLGFRPPQQHGDRHHQSVFLFVRRNQLGFVLLNISILKVPVGQHSRAQNVGDGAGVGSSGPAVGHGEHGCLRVVVQHNGHGQRPVAGRRAGLFQDVVPLAQVGKIEGVPVTVQKLCGAVRIGRQRTESLIAALGDIEFPVVLHTHPAAGLAVGVEALNGPLAVPRLTGGVEPEFHIPHGLARLIHLPDLLVQLGLEVEAEGQAGVVVAPLQIEHLQGVIGVAGKGISVPADRIQFFRFL